MDDDTTSLCAALFGLAGFEVLAAADAGGELELLVQTSADLVGCPSCGAVARAKDRRPTWVRDLPIGGRAVVLCWWKRVWSCQQPLCPARTWTEQHPAIAPRAGLTERARAWAFEQVGAGDATVSRIAATLGVAWWTVMRQVIGRGTGEINDPDRLTAAQHPVTAVGVDETAYLRATATHATTFATGIADLSPGRPARLLDVVEGRSGTVLAEWLADRDPAWRAGITTASLDPFRGYATALTSHLPKAVRVLDPFHVVRLALAAVDDVRRRVQQAQTGHRGRTGDPLYGIRRVLRTGSDLLTDRQRQRLIAVFATEQHVEVEATWGVYQRIVAAYRNHDRAAAKTELKRIIATITAAVPTALTELITLGRTLKRRAADVLAYFDRAGTSNGPTEAINGRLEHLRGSALGFRNLTNYIARSLLETGGFKPQLHRQSG